MTLYDEYDELHELEMAITLTEAILRYCQTPEVRDMHMAALDHYKKRYEELKKNLDQDVKK